MMNVFVFLVLQQFTQLQTTHTHTHFSLYCSVALPLSLTQHALCFQSLQDFAELFCVFFRCIFCFILGLILKKLNSRKPCFSTTGDISKDVMFLCRTVCVAAQFRVDFILSVLLVNFFDSAFKLLMVDKVKLHLKPFPGGTVSPSPVSLCLSLSVLSLFLFLSLLLYPLTQMLTRHMALCLWSGCPSVCRLCSLRSWELAPPF